jgi:hypothetical protein
VQANKSFNESTELEIYREKSQKERTDAIDYECDSDIQKRMTIGTLLICKCETQITLH